MGSRGSSWEKPGASSEDEASPRPGSLRVTGTWYPHTFPWEQPMLQVTAMPDILGLQGGSCGRWCFQKGFSKKDPCKRGLGKRILPKGPLKRGLPKRPCKKNILQRACVSSPGIKVPRQWAVIQGEHPPMKIAGIKAISSQIEDTSSLLKHFPAWGLVASPSGCGSPSNSHGVLQKQFTPSIPYPSRERGVWWRMWVTRAGDLLGLFSWEIWLGK